jgi:hypothetical protein
MLQTMLGHASAVMTLDRCGHLMLLVEPEVARVLERIMRDDERHVRWADIRIARLLSYEELRATNLLTGRVRASAESAWEKPWREVTRNQRSMTGR